MWNANKYISGFSSEIAKREIRIEFDLVVELTCEDGAVI